MGADGALTLLTRAPDRSVALYTSHDRGRARLGWTHPDADPARTDLLSILDEHGCRGKRLGVEWDAYGLTARNGRRLAAALDGFAELADASDLVTRLRVVKSPSELDYVRRAAELADEALEDAIRLGVPGTHVNEVLASMQATVFRGGGDYPGNEFIIGSGPTAKLGRYQSDRHPLGGDDVLAVEHAGVYRHYHACLFRTIKVGRPNAKHEALYALALESLAACKEALKPGNTFGDVYEAYSRVMVDGGYGDSRHNACGYGLGDDVRPQLDGTGPCFYRAKPRGHPPRHGGVLHGRCARSRGRPVRRRRGKR